jgi:hypothetical protein
LQQRRIDSPATRVRARADRLDAFGEIKVPDSDPFEKLRHY